MKKNILLYLLFMATVLPVMANPVTKEQARRLAADFLSHRGRSIQAASRPVHTAEFKTLGRKGAAYYVFNASADGGFVVISGDDRTDAVLGYADKGTFDATALPDNFKAWLQGYAAQIEALEEDVAVAEEETQRAAIAPLMKTMWNQGAPYNALCPVSGGELCMTGCVATAMTQIMYYHKWPEAATTAIPSYTTNTLKLEQEELPPVTFEWEKMRFDYNSGQTDTDNAVAQLMSYAGQSVRMDYTPYASAAMSRDVATALVSHFGYDPNVKYVHRSNYGVHDWHALIYGELAAGRPVYYEGQATDNGHAFVCDGYDGNGLYHINWGWGGYCDGFFKLEVLNPNGSGIGGSSGAGGYSMMQGIIVGVQKPTGEPEVSLCMTGSDLTFQGTTVTSSYWNNNPQAVKFRIGWAEVHEDGSVKRVLHDYGVDHELPSTYGYNQLSYDLSTAGLGVGTHRIVPVCCDVARSSTWQSIYGPFIYIEAKVKTDKSIELTQHPVCHIQVEGYEFLGNKVAGLLQEVAVNVSNQAEEYNGVLYLFASQTEEMGEAIDFAGVAIAPGESDIVTLSFTPETPGDYTLWVATDREGTEVIGETSVTITDPPRLPAKLAVRSFSLSAGHPTVVKAKVKNNGTEPYLRELSFIIFHEVKNADGSSYYDHYRSLTQYYPLEPGEEKEFVFEFEGLESGKTYLSALYYYATYDSSGMSYFDNTVKYFSVEPTGIDNVVSPDKSGLPADDACYTLDGRKVLTPKAKGIYIRNGKKVMIK